MINKKHAINSLYQQGYFLFFRSWDSRVFGEYVLLYVFPGATTVSRRHKGRQPEQHTQQELNLFYKGGLQKRQKCLTTIKASYIASMGSKHAIRFKYTPSP